MPALKFDHPAEDLVDEEDPENMSAIATGIAQFDAGEGRPLQELRKEFLKRCLK